jgi:hypothetical protein
VSGVPNVDSISVLCFFTNKEKHNTEILATLGTPDTGQRQTNKKHNTEILNVDSISVLCFLFVYLCPVSGVPNVDSISVLCFLFVCLCPVSGVPNVDSISVLCFCLFVFVLCLVYPMLTVYLCCVSGLFVYKKHNTEILSTLGTPDRGQRQTNKKHNT